MPDKLTEPTENITNILYFLLICVCVFRQKKMDLAHHGLVLLKRLNAQREFGFLCDCTVAIGDVLFKAHKAVLAAFSNYFRMLFIHQDRYYKRDCQKSSLFTFAVLFLSNDSLCFSFAVTLFD